MKDLLKKYLADEAKVTQFLEEMKSANIFTAREENLDARYQKLQGKYSAKEAEHQEALNLIAQMKQETAGQEVLQGKITEYETKIAQLDAQNKQLTRENSLKVALLGGKAKSDDIDYLMFKISQDADALKLNENGEITNMEEVLTSLKTNYPAHFEAGAKKKVEVIDLPNDEGKKDTVTKEEFNKMGYNARVNLRKDNPELYDKLTK